MFLSMFMVTYLIKRRAAVFSFDANLRSVDCCVVRGLILPFLRSVCFASYMSCFQMAEYNLSKGLG